MQFSINQNKNKYKYYIIFILIELAILMGLYVFIPVSVYLILFLTPFVLIDLWSNYRCARRQKNYIQKISINTSEIQCVFANNRSKKIPLSKSLFSIREIRFEKEKTEIEIREKHRVGSKLIGRLPLYNWPNIFEIKEQLSQNAVTQISYRPEGFWSKYGILTADTVITGSALTVGVLADLKGDSTFASDLKSDLFMPISNNKPDPKQEHE